MRIYQCDRCKRYILQGTISPFIRKPTRGVYRFGKKAHLCEDCAESFRQWFSDPRAKVANDGE